MLKDKRLIILVLSISLIFLNGCTTKLIEDNNLNNNKTARLPIEYTNDFEDGLDGWSGGFAGIPEDYTNNGYNAMVDEGDYNLTNGTSRGIYLTGNNLNDDMFMYSTRKFDRSDGLRPNTDYVVDFKFDLASNIPSNTRGIANNDILNRDTTNRYNVDLMNNNVNDFNTDNIYTGDRNDLDLRDNNLNNLGRDDTYTNRDDLDLRDNNLNNLGRDDTYTNRDDLDLRDNNLNDLDRDNTYNNRDDLDLRDNNLNDLDRDNTYTKNRNNLVLLNNNLNNVNTDDAYTGDRNDLDFQNNNLNGLNRNVNTIAGEKIYVKAGVVNVEPKADLTQLDNGEFYDMNLDKGTLADDGRDMVTLGNVAIDDLTDNSIYNQKSFQRTFHARTNENGELWAIIGIDSGYNGTSKLYLDNVSITIDTK